MPALRAPICPAAAAALVITTLAFAGDAPPGGDRPPAAVTLGPERAVIGNAFIAIELSTSAKKLRTSSITNRLTGATASLEGDDFVILLAGGAKLKESELVLERAAEETPEGGKGLVFELAGEGIKVRQRIALRPAEWWATRWIEIEGGKGRLEKLSLSEWRTQGTYGPPGPGKTVESLGYPEGHGQAAYVDDLFFAIEHPGAENFARGKRIACRIPAFDELGAGRTVKSRRFVVGAGEAGGAPQAFARFIGERRAGPARMVFLAVDRPSRAKGGVREAVESLVRVKAETGVPIDSFTLDEGWDLRDGSAPLWTRLDPARAPGGWSSLLDAARPGEMGLSLRVGLTGGEGGRDRLAAMGRSAGIDMSGDRLCLAGTGGRKHAIAAFSAWASSGMDFIEVDGFRPDCKVEGHGHPTGEGAAVAQMDALIEAFAVWRKARPGLRIAFTAGSNPSPFWLEHADFVGRGSAGGGEAALDGEPFDRLATSIDAGQQVHRPADLPASAFVTLDLDARRLGDTSEASFERNAWWLAARTSLHHAWCVEASDLSPERWKVLSRAARWAKSHEKLFRLARMVGGDPNQKSLYGFSAFEAGAGVLALRNPAGKPGTLEQALSRLLVLPREAAKKTYRLTGVFGETKALEGVRPGRSMLKVELAPFAIAIVEVREEG